MMKANQEELLAIAEANPYNSFCASMRSWHAEGKSFTENQTKVLLQIGKQTFGKKKELPPVDDRLAKLEADKAKGYISNTQYAQRKRQLEENPSYVPGVTKIRKLSSRGRGSNRKGITK